MQQPHPTFRPMRRLAQQLSQEQCDDILRRATSGTLALLGDNDYPYAVPMSFVYTRGCLYFHSALHGHKVDALRAHDKVSFCVIDRDEVVPSRYTTYYRSVIVFGTLHIVDAAAERLKAARALGDKYHPRHEASLQRELASGLSRMHVLRLDIGHVTGKQAVELMGKGAITPDETTHKQY
ncbi:MAG: pyridoxamine 5'-phosphate oxidase family protein [Bacteroidaceae bacterium]|nr:pyridoxamine 5'-phosphate oxidase family protein [Bacteroidaceae bacterium]